MSRKILHIGTSTQGGAGAAMLRIHLSLLELGVESKVLVRDTPTQQREVYVAPTASHRGFWYATKLGRFIRRFLHRINCYISNRDYILFQYAKFRHTQQCCITLPVSEYDLSTNPWVEWADIIHLHWVEDFLDYPTFFTKVNKPIVWTFHDMNAFMGCFHHIRLKDKYATLLGNLERRCYDTKKQALSNCSNLTLVALSDEMHTYIENHELYRGRPVFDIPNSVDTDMFTIGDMQEARSLFGVQENAFVFLFANGNLNDTEKGLQELVNAFQYIQHLPANSCLLCVGNGVIPPCIIPVIHIHKVNDPAIMARLYQAANVLVMPSHQEAFPLTPIEAMSCGTPVVITPVSGAADMMTQDTGVIAEDYSPDAIGRAIEIALKRTYNSVNIRWHVLENYTLQHIGTLYRNLYNQL